MDQIIQLVTVYAIPVIFAITLHEAAHGYVARYFGDLTAFAAGRVSLNPLRHIDPIGTVALPLGILALSALTGGGAMIFGWAKPVPINFGNLRNPKRDMLWVALAGPAMNLAMALFWALFLRMQLSLDVDEVFFRAMAGAGVKINILFMILNLIPIPPLDGGRIAVSLLPARLALRYAQIEPYGIFIVLLMIPTGILGAIISPLASLLLTMISILFGI